LPPLRNANFLRTLWVTPRLSGGDTPAAKKSFPRGTNLSGRRGRAVRVRILDASSAVPGCPSLGFLAVEFPRKTGSPIGGPKRRRARSALLLPGRRWARCASIVSIKNSHGRRSKGRARMRPMQTCDFKKTLVSPIQGRPQTVMNDGHPPVREFEKSGHYAEQPMTPFP